MNNSAKISNYPMIGHCHLINLALNTISGISKWIFPII